MAMSAGEVYSFLQGFLLLALVLLAALTDIKDRKILNLPSALAVLAGLTLGYLRGGWGAMSLDPDAQTGLFNAAAGMLALSVPFFFAYLARGMGASDVKLAAGVGALSGTYFALWALMHIVLAGAVLALVMIVWRGEVRRSSRRLLRCLARWRWREQDSAEVGEPVRIPYAVAIAAGVLWTIWSYQGQLPLPFL